MARRTANREKARQWQEEGIPKEEIMERLGVCRATLNLYLRTKKTKVRSMVAQ